MSLVDSPSKSDMARIKEIQEQRQNTYNIFRYKMHDPNENKSLTPALPAGHTDFPSQIISDQCLHIQGTDVHAK